MTLQTPVSFGAQPDQFRASYEQAVQSFASSGEEEDLAVAFDLSRQALNLDVGVGDLYEFHREAQNAVHKASIGASGVERAEEFFFEAIGVYDMTLRGNIRNTRRLREEIRERRTIEEQLRRTTKALEEQRDSLDAEVRRRTEEIANRAEDLRQTNDQLVQTLREQAEFTYAVSHDLKSPNNTIAMLLDILTEDFAPDWTDEPRELLQRARATTGRMSQLIVDILNYSQTLEKTSKHERFDPRPMIENIIADLQGDIQVSAANIHIGDLPEIHASKLHMRMLFQNLISNAVKFRDPTRPLSVDVIGRVLPGGNLVRFEVSDTGIGIDPRYQEKVFGLFQRLHLHDTYPGSGLGLALCQRIVGNHGGQIGLSSVPGQGSTFYFTLEIPS